MQPKNTPPNHADELLSRYLDGSLSEADSVEFNRIVAESADFAQEVRELSAVQGLLGNVQEQHVMAITKAAAFLSSVENNLASVIAGASAAVGVGATVTAAKTSASAASAAASAAATTVGVKTVATGASGLATVATGISSWLGIAAGGAAAVGGAATVYYMTTKPSTDSSASADKTAMVKSVETPSRLAPNDSLARATGATDKANELQQNAVAQQEEQSQTQEFTAAMPAQSTQTSETARSEESSNSASKPTEYSARISGTRGSKEKYIALANEYSRQLQAKEAQGDKTGAALLAKSLGTLFREMGRSNDARTQLQRAFNDGRSLGIRELEGEALAELAMLDASEGKKQQAVERLREAVVILTAAKSSSAARWQQELTRLEQSLEKRNSPRGANSIHSPRPAVSSKAEREAGPRFRAPQ